MEEITIKPLCLIIRFKNLTYKLWSLTEEGLLEQKQELINKLEKEFQFVEYVEINAAKEFAEKAKMVDNSKIDLTATDSWAKWSQDYVISNDFTAKLWFYNPNINSTLLTLTNDSGQIITVNYRQDIEDSTKAYTDLTSDGLYYIYTPSIRKPTDTQQVCIQIRRINNIYELKMEVI